MIKHISLLLLLSSVVPSSLGFAAWLKCNRGLEEDEIIMNNKVKKAPADEPVKLAVYDALGQVRVDVPSDEVDGGTVVWIDPSTASTSVSFVIRMDPETIGGLADIQYVVETAPLDDAKALPASESSAPSHGAPSPSRQTQPSPTPMIPTVSSPSPVGVAESSFVKASAGGGILCNGRRGHTRGKNGSVTYELVQESKDDNDTMQDGSLLAEVVAGYSEYHGHVTLTPRVSFKRRQSQSIENEEPPAGVASQGEL